MNPYHSAIHGQTVTDSGATEGASIFQKHSKNIEICVFGPPPNLSFSLTNI
jgi:hypothetical protein